MSHILLLLTSMKPEGAFHSAYGTYWTYGTYRLIGLTELIEFPKRELVDRTFLKFRDIPLNAVHVVYKYLMHFAFKRVHLMI